MTDEDREALEALDLRIRTLLPDEYEDSYETMEPTPMRAAPLAYDEQGRVAWDVIWGGFCDLALAGGPPHKGALLGPGTAAEIARDPQRYGQVTSEICRGITMATGLTAAVARAPGWIKVECPDVVAASWLLRAITVENVAVRQQDHAIGLPAAPHFRLDREIKNVVTVIAKTMHYWSGHLTGLKRWTIRQALSDMAAESPLIAPPDDLSADIDHDSTDALARSIQKETGLVESGRTTGWLSIACPDVRTAVAMMRLLVVSNVLSRREGQSFLVPVNPAHDASGHVVSRAVARAWAALSLR